MRTLLLDTFSGISGDMFLGLLLDLGLPPERLTASLAELNVKGYRLQIDKESRQSIRGTRFQVLIEEEQPARSWREIRSLLEDCPLERSIREKALAVFERLAEAEGRIHGVPMEEVHFHEVGAVDSIVDILGACIGLHALGIDRIISTPVPLTRGFVETAHGRLPLPAPATLALLEDKPVHWDNLECELVTPTGAALLREVADFSQYPDGQIQVTGYGVGSRHLPDRPNLLRGMLLDNTLDAERDCVAVLETHLDDANPEWLGALMDDLLEAGALDVAYYPLQMKKNRPGTGIRVIAAPVHRESLVDLLLRQSTTAGVRYRLEQRTKLRSEISTLETEWGCVEVKRFYRGDTVVRTVPEYRSCRALSLQQGIPLPEIYQRIQAAILKNS